MMENISYQSPFSGSFFMGFSMNQLFWVPWLRISKNMTLHVSNFTSDPYLIQGPWFQ
jgi:hypothetical protein